MSRFIRPLSALLLALALASLGGVQAQQERSRGGIVADLDPIGLNREISSVRQRFGNRPGRGQVGRGGNLLPEPSLTIYNETAFRGRGATVDRDMALLSVDVSGGGSIRVGAGRREVRDAPRFGGTCVIVTNDVSDTRRIGLRNRIASIRRR